MWAETSTLTFTAACGGSGTADDGVKWTVESDGEESNFDSTKGIHYGTGSKAVQYITLSTSDITETITKIVVNASTANGVSATVDVTVGGNAFGGDPKSLSSSATDYTFTGSASGEIIVTVTKPEKVAKALYVKSITVTYGSGSTVTKIETSLSISGNSTEVTMGESVATPTATVTSATGDPISASVKWSSSATDVATINESTGEIELKKAGKTTITATFEGDDTYEGSSANYELTVNAAAAEIPTYTSIEALQKNVTSTETPIKFTFNNIKVTAVKGKNAYITDGTYGALVYTDGHGLNAGDIINGTIETTLVLFRGQTEITRVKASDENLAITSGTVTPVEKTLSEITAANQSLLVTLKGLTYNESEQTFSYGSNSIKYYKNFTDDPTLEDGKVYDVTGVVIVYNTTIEISPLKTDDVVEVVSASQEAPLSQWVSGSENISSLFVLVDESVSANFETNSTGAKSFESSNTDVATVDESGKITLTGTAGVAVITAATEENSEFFTSSAKLTIIVAAQEAEDGVFDFALFNDYGSGIVPHNSNYNFDESTWTAGNVTMKVSGKYRWFLSTSNVGDFRLYSNGESAKTAFTVTAPEGFLITSISGVANSLEVNEGSIESNVWKGMANEVTFTYTANATMKKLFVVYSKPEVDVTIGEGYTSFCNASNVDFSETEVKVYIAKQSKGDVVLTQIESGIVPAGEGVILSGAAGTYKATVLATADKVEGNELKGVTKDTEVVYQQSQTMFNYILQGGKFKKATGDKLKAGRAYLHTQYDVATSSARELKIVVVGEATGIKAIETAADQNIYDLQGRKVAAPQKGLYIINGKKMIVK